MGHDITEPLRLARGSHQRGSGMGCAMNVVSWEQGDVQITDFPDCSAPPLAALVHGLNDHHCDHVDEDLSRLLCAACSAPVLDVAHRTIGTAGVATSSQWWRWWAELYGMVPAAYRRVEAVVSTIEMCEARARGVEHDGAWWLCNDFLGGRSLRERPINAPQAELPAEHIALRVSESLNDATARLAWFHAALDAWERITGYVPAPQLPQSVVDGAVLRMRETVP